MKPPEKTRFKKGISGNPQGRPKGSKNRVSTQSLLEMFLEEAGRIVTIHDSVGPVSMSTAHVVFRRLALAAAQGDHRTVRLLMETLFGLEAEKRKLDSRGSPEPVKYIVEWAGRSSPPERTPHSPT
jgi:hypothetical protein